MVWTCTTCGTEADSESVGHLVTMGWSINAPGEGTCPICSRKARQAGSDPGARRRENRRVMTAMLEKTGSPGSTKPI
jgi:hypothetical protein